MKRSAHLKTKNVMNSSENFEESSLHTQMGVLPLLSGDHIIVNVNSNQPDVIKMEKIFGVNTSLFNDVKYLKEASSKGFLFGPELPDKLHKICAVHRFELTDQDFQNLYFVATRFREKRDINGSVSIKNGRFVAEHDAAMRAAYVQYQDETTVILGKGKAKRSNPSGARYQVFDELIQKTVPWFVEEFQLGQNRAIHLFILLLIVAGYDDIEPYFNYWAKEKGKTDLFDPYTYPLSPEFLKHFENILKPKNEGKRVRLFFIALKKNPLLHVNDKVVPSPIKAKVISSIGPRPFTPEEIAKIKRMYKRFERRFKEEGIWPN